MFQKSSSLKRRKNKSAKCIYGFSDIDECEGNHSCHVNATCNNTLGSHVCECQPGYTGNGQNCTGEFDSLLQYLE